MSELKVIIADRDSILSRNLSEFLNQKGFAAKLVSSGEELKKMILDWKPDIVLADIVLPDMNGLQLVPWIESQPTITKDSIKVVISSAHSSIDNIRKVIASGAIDFITKPYKQEDLIPRFAFYLQEKRQLDELKKQTAKSEGGDFFLYLTQIMMKEATADKPPREVLFNLTKMLAMSLDAVRCSIIETHREVLNGYVKVSSDDFKVNNIKLDLNRYPEVCYVMNNEKMVAIENMSQNATLAEIKKHVQSIQFNALIVCPIKRSGQFFGVVSARMKQRASPYTERELRFVQLVAAAASLVMSSSQAAELVTPAPAPPALSSAAA